MLNRRILFLTVVMLAVVGTIAIGGAAAQEDVSLGDIDGDGTSSSPYQVDTVDELNALRNYSGGDLHVEITGEINASETSQWNSGNGFQNISLDDSVDNTVHIDGQNNSISDLTLNGSLFRLKNSSSATPSVDISISNLEMDDPYVADAYEGLYKKSLFYVGEGTAFEAVGSVDNVDIDGLRINGSGRAAILGYHTSWFSSPGSDFVVSDTSVTGNITTTADFYGLVESPQISTIDGVEVDMEVHSSDSAVHGIARNSGGLLGDITNSDISVDVYGASNFAGIGGTGATGAGTISNINLDIDSKVTGDSAGLLGGTTTFDNIDNITGSVEINNTDGGSVSGLVVNSDSDSPVVSDVNIQTDLTSDGGAVGGILYERSGNPHTFENITISGELQGSSVGGLAVTTFTNPSGSANVEDINIDAKIDSSDVAGGIVGERFGVNGSNIVISGNISGNNIGGIVGYSDESEVNVSDVSVSGNLDGNGDTGGILGYTSVTSETLRVSDSSISGDIDSGGYAGGVVGNYASEVDMSNVSVSSEITGQSATGGLIGLAEGTITGENLEVTDDVSGNNDVGGIYGSTSGGTGSGPISDVYIRSDIVAESGDYAGIVGAYGSSNSVVYENISYIGDLEGNTIIGTNNYVDVTDSFIKIQNDVDLDVGVDSLKDSIYISNGSLSGTINTVYTLPGSSYGTPVDSEEDFFRNGQSDKLDQLNFNTTWQETPGYPTLRSIDKQKQYQDMDVPFTVESINSPSTVDVDDGLEIKVTAENEVGPWSESKIITLDLLGSPSQDALIDSEKDNITMTESEETLEWELSEEVVGENRFGVYVDSEEYGQYVVNITESEDSLIGGSGDDTTFTSFDIPGTDISVPLLPVGGILAAILLVGGYVYYREEDVEFQ